MFNFLKKKLKSWKEKSKKKVEEKAKKQEKEEKEEKIAEAKQEKVEKQDKKIEEPIKKEKPEKEAKKQEIKEPKQEKKEEPEKEKQEGEKSFFQKIKSSFSYKLQEEDFEDIFENLEEILLENNTALETIDEIKKNLKQELEGKEIKQKEIEKEIQEALKQSIEKILIEPFDLVEKAKTEKPFVILFLGINGSGKTTTIAKISNLLQKNNLKTVLAAADTFRAASIEQLSKHAEKLKTEIIKQHYGADPTAVAFDAIKHAKAKNADVVLIDTAGRMHTKENLIRELEKIVRVTKPNLKVFVAESITGNDATEQAKIFNDAIGIDTVILTKADIDEKGGNAISISQITEKPILFLGTGQEYKDLTKFNKQEFLEKLGL